MHAHLQQPIVRPSTSWIILFWSIPEERIYSLITSYQQLSVIIRLLSERFFSKTTGLVEKRDEFQTIDSWHLMPCQPQSYLGEEFQMKNVTGLLSWIVYNWEKKKSFPLPHTQLACYTKSTRTWAENACQKFQQPFQRNNQVWAWKETSQGVNTQTEVRIKRPMLLLFWKLLVYSWNMYHLQKADQVHPSQDFGGKWC